MSAFPFKHHNNALRPMLTFLQCILLLLKDPQDVCVCVCVCVCVLHKCVYVCVSVYICVSVCMFKCVLGPCLIFVMKDCVLNGVCVVWCVSVGWYVGCSGALVLWC